MNLDVKPIVQSERRVPIPLEDAVSEELDRLEREGIIERVNEYAPWQSSMVPVAKERMVQYAYAST